jgi:hypothetical protein
LTVPGYFRRGSNAARVMQIFTNREVEREAFHRLVALHDAWKSTIRAIDVDVPRENIVVFHGLGGIGKSSLLRELQHGVAGEGGTSAGLIVDFQDTTAFDVEELLLRIRATIGELGVRCVAFDFALSYYWGIVHPGTPLETYTRNSSVLRRLSSKLGVSEQVESSVVEVVSSIVSASQLAHGATRLAQAVSQIVAHGARVKHAVAECDILPMFLQSSSIEQNLTYLPALLAWDLERAGNPRVVIFFDTYEEVTRRGRQVEQILQRVCYLLPNVLFVVAGRNRLDWSDANLRGTLDYAGEESWPYLASSGRHRRSDQFLVGDLSPRDSERYLSERLVKDGTPAMPRSVRDEIVAAAEGWPLYLDVAASHYLEALSRGTEGETSFTGPFAALVSRLTTDLSSDERQVLRAASLLVSFDEDLLHAAAGGVSRGVVQRVLSRPFVKHGRDTAWPFSLHSALREALHVDTGHEDTWTEVDWQLAAGRALDELRRRTRDRPDRRQLAACLQEGLSLAHRYRLDAPWLSSAAIALARANGSSSIRAVGDFTTPASALSRLLAALGRHALMPVLQGAAEIEQSISDTLSATDLFWARTMQADDFLSSGDVARAESIYRDILAAPAPSPLVNDAKTMFSLILLKRGAFQELDRYARDHADEVNAYRLRGDVNRLNARWSYAEALYRAGLEAAEADGDVGLAALFRAELALVDGWTAQRDPSVWRTTEDLGVGAWTEVSHLVARALYFASTDGRLAEEALALAAEVANNFGLSEGAADIVVARGFLAGVRGDTPAVAAAASELGRWVSSSGTYASWLQVLKLWSGVADFDDRVHWLDGTQVARSAWLRTLKTRAV